GKRPVGRDDDVRGPSKNGGGSVGGLAFIAVTAASLITSLASSRLAAGWGDVSWALWSILALGLIGAVAALLNWAWKPGRKAISRTRGANALRAEGWAFVHRRGHYVGFADVREAFGTFVDEVLPVTSKLKTRGRSSIRLRLPCKWVAMFSVEIEHDR